VIALDTNVLLRFVLADASEPHTAVAERWIRRHARDGILVDHIVLCETLWVLQARYRWARAAVATLVGDLLEADGFAFDDDGVVRRTLDAYRAGKGDFSDYLIRERARAAGAEPVATFDRALKGESGFHLLG
jgi:predicted nucleic-acid-binding protein